MRLLHTPQGVDLEGFGGVNRVELSRYAKQSLNRIKYTYILRTFSDEFVFKNWVCNVLGSGGVQYIFCVIFTHMLIIFLYYLYTS